MTQSRFSSSLERPQSHFPPSPRAPMRSCSCGQLKAGGKKSPVNTRGTRRCSLAQGPSMEGEKINEQMRRTNCVCRPWFLVRWEPALAQYHSATSQEPKVKSYSTRKQNEKRTERRSSPHPQTSSTIPSASPASSRISALPSPLYLATLHRLYSAVMRPRGSVRVCCRNRCMGRMSLGGGGKGRRGRGG